MSTAYRTPTPMTLEEFLRLPHIDEKPYLEFIDGEIEAKVSPQKRHSRIQSRILQRLEEVAEIDQVGLPFPELRCTFGGRSLIPDVVFLLREHIELDAAGEYVDETPRPPDIHIEIVSPDQAVRKNRDRILFSMAHGCPLGWLIDPERRKVEVYRPGKAVQTLAGRGSLDGSPVLPDFRLPVTELFGWLRPPGPRPPRSSPEPGAGGS